MSRTKPVLKASMVVLNEADAESLLSGGDDYSYFLAMKYFRNLLGSTDPKSASAYKICHAIEDNNSIVEGIEGFPAKAPSKGTYYKDTKKPSPNSINPEDWQTLINYFDQKLEEMKGAQPSVGYVNLDTLGEKLHLDDTEIETLKFLHAVDQQHFLEMFANEFIERDKSKLGPLISRFLGKKELVGNISSIFHPDSALARFGLIDFFMWDENETSFPPVDDNIKAFLNIPNLSADSIVEQLIGKPAAGDLDIKDFSYLDDEINRILKIIKTALEKGSPGINILLSGPAGAGKTELAKAIAKELGVTLYAVGEEQEGPPETPAAGPDTSKQRMGKLFQAHAFLKGAKDTILLFDEIEDLLLKGTDTDKKSDTSSKIIVNRLLETNPIVTIWAGNEPDKFHESMRQRFSYAIHVDYPPMMMRKKIWQRQLDMHGAKLDEPSVTQLSREYMAPARMIANAVKMAASTNDVRVEEIEEYLEASSRITYGDSQAIKSNGGVSEKFDLALINYDVSHQNEMGALIEAGQKVVPYALFVQGREGTGIRSLGRYLAEKAVLNQAEYSLRSIVAPHPFSSPEGRLTSAFEQASDSKKLLIFSDMDMLAGNPESETSDWRDGIAPLFMKLLGDHELPVIAHSYRMGASFPSFIQDGFPIRLKISPLTQDQQEKAFKIYFGDIDRGENTLPKDLVPSDFAGVAKIRAKSIGNHFSAVRIAELLKQHADNRKAESPRAGF